jgi:ATP-dependent Clp protease ATP-binding subunit ClpA
MFERFTDGARELVLSATDATATVGDNAIGAEHLLSAAFVAEPSNPAVATLVEAGVTKDKILPPDRTSTTTPPPVRPRLPFTGDGKAATNQTVVEAQAVGADRVGVEHFVLALLGVSERARQLVRTSGADPDVLGDRIRSTIF